MEIAEEGWETNSGEESQGEQKSPMDPVGNEDEPNVFNQIQQLNDCITKARSEMGVEGFQEKINHHTPLRTEYSAMLANFQEQQDADTESLDAYEEELNAYIARETGAMDRQRSPESVGSGTSSKRYREGDASDPVQRMKSPRLTSPSAPDLRGRARSPSLDMAHHLRQASLSQRLAFRPSGPQGETGIHPPYLDQRNVPLGQSTAPGFDARTGRARVTSPTPSSAVMGKALSDIHNLDMYRRGYVDDQAMSNTSEYEEYEGSDQGGYPERTTSRLQYERVDPYRPDLHTGAGRDAYTFGGHYDVQYEHHPFAPMVGHVEQNPGQSQYGGPTWGQSPTHAQAPVPDRRFTMTGGQHDTAGRESRHATTASLRNQRSTATMPSILENPYGQGPAPQQYGQQPSVFGNAPNWSHAGVQPQASYPNLGQQPVRHSGSFAGLDLHHQYTQQALPQQRSTPALASRRPRLSLTSNLVQELFQLGHNRRRLPLNRRRCIRVRARRITLPIKVHSIQ